MRKFNLSSGNFAFFVVFSFARNFAKPVFLLTFILMIGSTGYRLIENWSYIDSLYMTLITLSTVGFGEVHPLSSSGRLFTMGLVLSGIVLYAFTVNSIIKVFVEQRFTEFVNRERMKQKIQTIKNHIIICGGGRMALSVGQELEKAGKDFVFIEKSADAVVFELKDRWPIIEKDALLEETLIEARIEQAVGLAAVLSTDADNLFAVLTARKLNPKLSIQTRIASESTRSKMMLAGADLVVSPQRIGGLQIARHFINPEVESFLSVVLGKAGYEFEMKTHRVTKEDRYVNQPIKDAGFREEGFIVISVRYPNGGMIFAPKAHIRLTEGMDIFLFGPGEREQVENHE